MDSLRFRTAGPGDAVALSRLLGQLGYPSAPEEIPDRLQKMHERSGTTVMIAEDDSGAVGVATIHLFQALHTSAPIAWLTAVVVEEHSRGKGIGAALLRRAEEWAIERGANRLSLTSALHRTRAHEFYKSHSYEQTGVRLVKSFDAGHRTHD